VAAQEEAVIHLAGPQEAAGVAPQQEMQEAAV
jgi:hypothetical protein